MAKVITRKYFKYGKVSSGFTIIELIVVVAIFLFIIGAALAIFISIFQHQKKILAEQEFLNQISYAQEYMSKALRTAKVATDDSCISTGYVYMLTRYNYGSATYKGIKFINQSDTDASGNPVYGCQEFFLDVASPSDTRLVLWEAQGNEPPVALTATNLEIDSIKFSLNGSDGSAAGCSNVNQCGAQATASAQARVTISLNIKIAGDTQEPTRTIQTTVSQRNLNSQ